MMNKQSKHALVEAPGGKSYLVPFVLITSLFLLWGFAHGLLDVLNKHFQLKRVILKRDQLVSLNYQS